MNRDMDLVRKLLVYFDEKPGPEHVMVPDIEGFDESNIKNHLVQLYEAGLIRAESERSSTSNDRVIRVIPFDLTWQGHEFLDKIRNETVWQQIKSTAQSKGLPLTLEVVGELATKIFVKLMAAV
jgi:hypothetical protein